MSSGRSSYSLFHFAHNVGCPNISLSMIRNVVPEKSRRRSRSSAGTQELMSANAQPPLHDPAVAIARIRARVKYGMTP